jgi:ribonuclease P protein component
MSKTLGQEKKLKGITAFRILFDKGRSMRQGPMRILFHPSPGEEHRVGVAVPKKRFKRAADRNLLKRRMREAYRNHQEILDPLTEKRDMLFIYQSSEILTYQEIEGIIILLLQRLISE